MTIGGMTAPDNISLELDQNSLIVIPKDADFYDTESSLPMNWMKMPKIPELPVSLPI